MATVLVLVLLAGVAVIVRGFSTTGRTHVVAYFDNTNGIYVGDRVVVLGVPIGQIERIEPQPQRVKVSFWYSDKYRVPADVKAVILSPTLVTARSIQLTPPYTGGEAMRDDMVIPQERTAVPVEWDAFREELEKLTETLQPTEPGGVSALGSFVNTAADNLRGQGVGIREALIKLSRAVSALGDHSDDIFTTTKNLSILVSALRDSSNLLQQLNRNLAAATGLVANDPGEVGRAVKQLKEVVGDVTSFVAENREAAGVASERLASITKAVTDRLDDVKQTLHVAAPAIQNFVNIYQPAQGTLTGILAANNFANTIQFLCGAVEAASRRGAEESAKLCVQYLAPIVKNRQYNFFPLGINPFVGTMARPNELTYSEDWLRPDYIPPAGPRNEPPLAAEQSVPADTPMDPKEDLHDMMLPGGGR
ncbi:MCE family protein [Mycolicibacterium sp. XJ1819]